MLRIFSGIRARLILLVLPAVVPTLAVVLRAGLKERAEETRQARENALQIARLVAAQQERLVEAAQQFLFALVQLPEIQSGDPQRCSTLFAALLRQNRRYANLTAARPNGDIFASAVPFSEPLNASDQPWFRRAIQTRDFVVGDYRFGRTVRNLSFLLPVPCSARQVKSGQ